MDRLEFCARAAQVGFTPQILAKLTRTTPAQAASWLDIAWDVPVPAMVVFALHEAEAAQKKAVKCALDLVFKKTKPGALHKVIQLPYWKSQKEYVNIHPHHTSSDYRLINAQNVALAHALSAHGYEVRWMASEPSVAYKLSQDGSSSDV